MNAREAQSLLAVQKETGVVIAEAFMVRSHPQWIAARNLIAEGRIGRLQCISYLFSYNNSDPMNIRNIRGGRWRRSARYRLLRSEHGTLAVSR